VTTHTTFDGGADGPSGHRVDSNHQDCGFGWIPVQTHDLVTGTVIPTSSSPNFIPNPSAAKTYSGSDAMATKSAYDAQAASKVAALTAYRMARRLCRYCAVKWVKGHKCAATVPLHVVQEIWEMLSTDSNGDQCAEDNGTEEQVFMLLSQEALAPNSSSKTLTFQGLIQGQLVVILVDSGSSNLFLNTKLVPDLAGVSKVASPIKVQVANGHVIQCQSELL
jgi:hypothetical protein